MHSFSALSDISGREGDAGVMAPVHARCTLDRNPGWLRRAWEVGLANAHWPGSSDTGLEHGYLLRGGIPETLEPFISAAPAIGTHAGETRILDFERLDSAGAAALLAALPTGALGHDLAMFAPSTATMLRVVAQNPGVAWAEGSAYSPELPAEAIRPRWLTILDPSLVDVTPDVLAGPLPDWLDELSTSEYAEYLTARQHCITHGITRPAWLTAMTRYGIDDARRYPYAWILTHPDGAIRGVQFAW